MLTADSGISDTEDEEKPSGKEPTTIKVAENDVEQSHGAADLEETKATLESPAVVESQVTADAMETETPEAVTEASSSSAPSTETPASEEESGKAIDVESVGAPALPATEESSKILTTEEPICNSEMTNEGGEVPAETAVSDKKRPLEKEDGGEGADDGEHSPDAKQPRIFSPDKVHFSMTLNRVTQFDWFDCLPGQVVEEEAKTEVTESESQGSEELPVATATLETPVEKTIEAEVPAENQ